MNQVDNNEPQNGSAALVKAAAEGAAIQKVETPYATAMVVQKPRKLQEVMKRLEEEAALSGDAFFYGWGAGQDKIEGASVKLANAAIRCYGNCAIDLKPVQETKDAWIFTAIFVDLETGFTLPRQFRQAKNWKVYGKHDDARKEDIRFQIGQSKAIRNLVLNALPAALIDHAMDVAKEGSRNKLEKWIADFDKNNGKGKGIVSAVDTALRVLLKNGVTEDRVLFKFSLANRSAIDVERLVIMQSDNKAIDRGEARADELYPMLPVARPDAMADKLAEGMGKDETTKASNKKDEPPAEATKKPKTTGKNQQQRIEGVDEDETDLEAAAR